MVLDTVNSTTPAGDWSFDWTQAGHLLACPCRMSQVTLSSLAMHLKILCICNRGTSNDCSIPTVLDSRATTAHPQLMDGNLKPSESVRQYAEAGCPIDLERVYFSRPLGQRLARRRHRYASSSMPATLNSLPMQKDCQCSPVGLLYMSRPSSTPALVRFAAGILSCRDGKSNILFSFPNIDFVRLRFFQ